MPLFEEEKHYKIQALAAANAINAYTGYFQRMLGCYAGDGNVKGKKWTKGHHKFIPSSSVRCVISCLKLVRDYQADKEPVHYNPVRLLDCGCGVGNILLLARGLSGYIVTGLEFEPEVVAIAQSLMHDYNSNRPVVLQQDILTYDSYSLYDVIYYYQPISNDKKTRIFVRKVNNDMKVGAVVVTYGGGSHHLERDKRFKAVFARYSSVPENIKRMAWEKVKE